MGIVDFLTGEFIDVIHRTDDKSDTMEWRLEREAHEIKYGAKLTVREGHANSAYPSSFAALSLTGWQ